MNPLKLPADAAGHWLGAKKVISVVELFLYQQMPQDNEGGHGK